VRLASFVRPSRPERGFAAGLVLPHAGVVVDLDLAASVLGHDWDGAQPGTPLDWFDLDGPWPGRARAVLAACDVEQPRRALEDAGAILAATAVRLGPPVRRPGKVVCVGLNYRDHAREARMEVPSAPVIFAKFSSALIGPGDAIVLPAGSTRVDYEAELAVVIGRRARGVAIDDAPTAVFGYANANDVSERDFQKQDGQWVRAKSCDTFAPMGPWVVSADEVGNPHDLRIELRVNGVVMQDSSTRELVFGIPDLVSFVARTITLEPGDVILTGTPAGVGFARRPPVYLREGDVVEVAIDCLGVLRNPVVRDSVLP
jgi:2-keto-4-pentenoate hydratase/2-oxohepta-3-ene-1,7-dioic acid hydratase in catechol pathway